MEVLHWPCLLCAQFIAHAAEIEDVLHQEASDLYNAIASIGATITSLAVGVNKTFPYITIPQFEGSGFLNNKISQALQVSFAPLVKTDKIEAWDNYSVEKQGWIDESLDLAVKYFHEDHNNCGSQTNFVRAQIPTNIYYFENYDEGKRLVQTGPGVQFRPGNYAPVWQQAPAPCDPSIINFDLLSHPVISRRYHDMWTSQSPVISEVTNLEFMYRGALGDDVDYRPRSFLLQPVYPSFDNNGTNDIAGIVLAVLDWGSYFSGLIQSNGNRVKIVVDASCGGSFTYIIDGP